MDRLNAMTVVIEKNANMSEATAKAMLNAIFHTPGVIVDPVTNAMYVSAGATEDKILRIIRDGGFVVAKNFPIRYVEVPVKQGLSGIPYKDGVTIAILLTKDNLHLYDTWISEIDPKNIEEIDGSGF